MKEKLLAKYAIEADTYSATVICRNCKLKEKLYFKRGVSIYKHRCPVCHVMYLGSEIIK